MYIYILCLSPLVYNGYRRTDKRSRRGRSKKVIRASSSRTRKNDRKVAGTIVGDIAEFMFLLSCLLTCVKCAFSWISAFTDKVVAYSVTTIGSHETNEEPNKI